MEATIIQHFIDAINHHDTRKMALLMSDDHVFMDAHGNIYKGKDDLALRWQGYFLWFPDYKIEVSAIMNKDSEVAVFGFAEATYMGKDTDENEFYWRLPVAWHATIENQKIKQWQVYCDTKIPFDIMELR